MAGLLFRGSDMNHDNRLSFTEFATIAVLLSAARSFARPYYKPYADVCSSF
jgi:hypothetical protein